MKLFFLLPAFFLIFFNCANSPDYHPIISFITGSVTINGTQANLKNPIRSGDRVETGKASSCEILLNDKSILRLGADTLVRFKPDEYIFDLEKGWLSGLTRKQLFKSSTYHIKTSTTIASVRGTSFCVKAESPDSTYFCVCNGNIRLEDGNKTNIEEVSSFHHTARRFVRSGGKINVEKPEQLYHSDKDIEHLAESIHEHIDWTKPE